MPTLSVMAVALTVLACVIVVLGLVRLMRMVANPEDLGDYMPRNVTVAIFLASLLWVVGKAIF